MTKTEPTPGADRGALWMLAALALTGLIPWIDVLFGEPPAYTAELGAAVTIVASALLIASLVEAWRDRRRGGSSDGDDT